VAGYPVGFARRVGCRLRVIQARPNAVLQLTLAIFTLRAGIAGDGSQVAVENALPQLSTLS